MPYTPTRLYQGQLPSTETTASPGLLASAVPAATTWIVKEILLCNTSGSKITVSISVVPTGSTGGNSNRIVNSLQIASNSTTSFGLSTVMGTGDFITAVASSSNVITATISGVVIT